MAPVRPPAAQLRPRSWAQVRGPGGKRTKTRTEALSKSEVARNPQGPVSEPPSRPRSCADLLPVPLSGAGVTSQAVALGSL